MTTQCKKPEITGTRTGYVIRFTCPLCAAENIIINKTPRDHFKESRDATCSRCRKRSTVITPNGPTGKPAHDVASPGITQQMTP
jgi:hypothetical protein